LEAVSAHAVEAAIQAADQSVKADDEIRQALCREFEEARYEASLAARRYEVVDPTKCLVPWSGARMLRIASPGMTTRRRFVRRWTVRR
jgi:hypothetical protein